jgi:hypothetical protein
MEEEVKTEQPKKSKRRCVLTQNKNYVIGAVILIAIIAFAVYSKKGGDNFFGKMFSKNITKEVAKTKFEDFVKKNVPEGTDVKVGDVTEENGLYKIPVTIAGQQEIISYMTKDGAKLFPQSIDMTEADKTADAATPKEAKEIPKSDKPVVKLFVMSYCPYGTQMEKGILPVIKALGTKIDYTLEFVNYAMHGDKEIEENLVQYCIQNQEPAKLSSYLTCFLKKGEGTTDACMKVAGVNAFKVKSCVATTDAKFNIKKDAADKNKWSNGTYPPFNVNADENVKYGVQGSPTLVVNDVEASAAGRDSASILKTICGAFNVAPKECETQLSATAPAPGFGEGTAPAGGAATNASCGS